MNKDLSRNTRRFLFELTILFRLWLPEFLGIWESVCNNPDWEQVSFPDKSVS